MFNPMQLVQILKGNKSPKEVCFDMLGANTNPMVKNLLEMAKNGRRDEIETFARNMFKEQGRDFDKEFNEFMTNFK